MEELFSSNQIKMLVESASLLSDANKCIANSFHYQYGEDCDMELYSEYICAQNHINDAIAQVKYLIGSSITQSLLGE